MKPVAVILNDKELVRLLTHLGLPVKFPVLIPAPKACDPPDEDCQLDLPRTLARLEKVRGPRADLYEEIEPAPAGD